MKPKLIQNPNYSDISCYGRAKVPHINLILSAYWGSFMLHKPTLQLQKMQLHLNKVYHKLVLLGKSFIH